MTNLCNKSTLQEDVRRNADLHLQALERVAELEEALNLIRGVEQLESANPFSLIENICHEVLGD